MRFGHANLWIWTGALLLAEHETDDSGQVRSQRQQLQVEHQRQVIFEHRRSALRLRERRQLDVALRFGRLNSAFDVPDRFGVFLDPELIRRSQRLYKARELFVYGIKNVLDLWQSG